CAIAPFLNSLVERRLRQEVCLVVERLRGRIASKGRRRLLRADNAPDTRRVHVLVCRQSPTLYEVRNLACNLLSTPASSTSNPHAMHRPESRATARRSTRSPTVEPAVEAGRLFDAGSRTGRLMRSRDWSATALGPVQEWPDNLKAPLRLMLASSQPAFIW